MSTQDRKAKAQAAAKNTAKGGNAIVIGGVVIILAIALVVGGVIWSATKDSGGAGDALPKGVAAGAPLEPYADANPAKDAPVVDVYEDFRCPACKLFETYEGETFTQLAQDGKIRLRVHLKTVIDSLTGGDSSAVAGSSAVCALDQGVWTEYHKALFDLQPESETPEGFPEEAYTEAAKKAGLSGADLDEWQQCTDEGTYVNYIRSVDEASVKDQITGTPTVIVNGTKFNWGAVIDQKTGKVDAATLTEILTTGTVPENMVPTQ